MLNNNDIMMIYYLRTILESVYVRLGCTLLGLSCECARCAEPLSREAGLTVGLMIGGLGCCTVAIAVFGLGICSLCWSRQLTISTGTYEQYYNVQNTLDLAQPQPPPFPSLHRHHPQP